MTPDEFRSRYLASLPPDPPGVETRCDEFHNWSWDEVDALPISNADRLILAVAGLPRRAAPFLDFGRKGSADLKRMSDLGFSGEFSRYRTIGSNGSGDTICIDEAAGGTVVYLNHDQHMQRSFLNSSIVALASCLCIYQDFWRDRRAEVCRAAIRAVDPPAIRSGSFWDVEIDNAMDDD